MMKRPAVLGVIAALFAVAIAAQSRQPAGTSHNGKAFRFNKVKEGVYHAIGTGSLAVVGNSAFIVNDNDFSEWHKRSSGWLRRDHQPEGGTSQLAVNGHQIASTEQCILPGDGQAKSHTLFLERNCRLEQRTTGFRAQSGT